MTPYQIASQNGHTQNTLALLEDAENTFEVKQVPLIEPNGDCTFTYSAAKMITTHQRIKRTAKVTQAQEVKIHECGAVEHMITTLATGISRTL